MKTPRALRSFLIRSLIAAALSLSSTPAFAISREDLAALRAKAETGNGIAQYNLGLLYASVSEPIADPIEAYVWFKLAADNGATGRALVMLSSQLTKEQVTEAKQRLDARRTELDLKKRKATNSANPVSAVETSPVTGMSSPIVAAPSLPDPPISAGPISEREFLTLQSELKRISGELSGAWKESEQLKATIAKMGQASTAAGPLQHEHDQLRAKLASANDEVARLRGDAGNFENERNVLLQKIATADQTRKDTAAAELDATVSKLRSAETQLAQALVAGEELARAKQTAANLNEQVQKLSAENQRLTSLAARAESTVQAKTAAEKELSILRSEVASARAQLAAAKASEAETVGTARKQVEDTHVKLEATLRSLDLQQKETDRFQKALANIDGEREGLAKQLAALKAAPSKADIAAEQRITKLTADLETARASGRQVAQLQKLLSDHQSKLKSVEADLAQANQEKDQLGGQLAAAKAAPVAPPGELTRLNIELNDARSRLAAAEQALSQAKSEREQAAREAVRGPQQQVAQLTSELQQLRQNSSASEEALAKANQERAALRQQLSTAAASAGAAVELAAVQRRLKSAEDALSSAQAERTALTGRLSAAEMRANSLAALPAAAASGEDPVPLRQELSETQSKLLAALRTYQLQQDDIARLQQSLAALEAERTQLASRAHDLNTQVNQAQAQAAANQDAAVQLGAVREQFRQAQNQIASLAGENSQLKNRVAGTGPSPATPAAVNPPAAGLASASQVAPPPMAFPTATVAVRSTPAPPTRPAALPAPRTHTVSDGDTLTKIARRYYGSSDRWPQILDANRSVIKDVNNLTLGSSLRIP